MKLTPSVAAELAKDVYLVRESRFIKVLLTRKEFSGESRVAKKISANTGIYSKDAFGVCAMGGAGYENELFIIFRGTDTAHDVISDLWIGISRSKTGLPVHSGFNRVFESLLPQLKQFLATVKQVKKVHCIGHSLGGAIATLAADWIKSNKGLPVQLYTFGAPRPGLTMFAQHLSQKIWRKNIFRVYHATDPVPMIPLYPFVHPPLPGYGHYLPSSQGIFSHQAHAMDEYIKSVEGMSWSGLERRTAPYNIESAVELWLKSASPVTSRSPHIWQWINAALIYVLKKITFTAALLLQSGVTGAVTLADTIAYILYKGINISKDIGGWVLLLIRKIMQALGMAVIETVEAINRVFLSRILVRLMNKTNEEARNAIRKID